MTTNIAIALHPGVDDMLTPATLADAISTALAFGTDDPLSTYTDPMWNALPTVLDLAVPTDEGSWHVGTITLGARPEGA